VSTLSQLAEKVDITLINIPPAVYLHDLKEEDRITIPRHPMPIFAMPLPDIVDRSGIPRFFDDVLDFLGKMAKKQRDIFKGCDDKHLVHVLRDCYDRNQFLSLDDYDPRVVAAVLKLYLYQLPVPLLPVSHISLPIEDTVKFCQRTFSALPYANQVLLSKLCDVMCDLAATTSWNSPGYLSACIAPSLVALSSSSRDGLAIAIRFFRNLLTFWPEISIEPRSKLQTNDHGQDPDRSKIPALTRQKYRNHSTPELRSPRPSIQEHQQRAASSQSMGSQALPYIPPPLKSSSVKRAVDRGTGITAQKPAPPPARGTPTLHQSSAGAYGGVLQITAKVNLPPSGQKPCGITKSPIRTRAPSPPPPRRFGPRLKSVASTKRGKMVAEIARLYEEKCAAAQVLVEMGNQSEDKP
jgi:Rho GTPase-activating protein 1